MLDNLSQELLRNSPTFRNQMSAAFTTVAIARWKAAKATILGVDALLAAGTATTEHVVARTLATTETQFLEQALATQKIYLVSGLQQPVMMGGEASDAAAKEGITKLINQMLGSPASTWAWTVADWQDNQDTAAAEIATHLNNMFAAMVAAPSVVAQQIMAAAAEMPVLSPAYGMGSTMP